MVRFPNTRNQIEDLEAHFRHSGGVHKFPHETVASVGLDVGSVDFDPLRHGAHQIDLSSPMAEYLGVEQVRKVLPMTPLLVRIVLDEQNKGDHPVVAGMKRQAGRSIAQGIQDIMPSFDRFDIVTLTGEDSEPSLDELCDTGLAIVVGDLERVPLPDAFNERADVVALKVNHPSERSIPANVGKLSLGGVWEVNTDNSTQLQRVNAWLEDAHNQRLARFEAAGAITGSYVLDAQAPDYVVDRHVDEVLSMVLAQVR